MKIPNPLLTKSHFFHLCMILLFWLHLSSCAGTKETALQEEKPEEPAPSGIIEDIDPMSLEEIDFTVESNLNVEAESSEAYRYLTADRDDSTGATEEKLQKQPGYRVQIASVAIQEDADEIQLEAILEFEESEVYLIFETPYYKIRVGDFVIRRDAEALQEKAVELGYGDAWIVRTIITPKTKNPDIMPPDRQN
ncbi:MAG: SPOR domain-containing protein [bacterium]